MADALDIIIDQYLAAANQAYETEKFQDAYKICTKIFEIDPENKNAIELRNKIEDAVQNYNIHLIQKELEKLEPWWKEGRYQELVVELQKLYRAAPNYTKLEKLLADAEEKYREQVRERSQNTLQDYKKSLVQLLQEKKYNEVIEKIFATEQFRGKDPSIRTIHTEIKDQLVDIKLEEKKELLASNNYEDILNLLYRLRNIHPSSEKIQKLLRTYREKFLQQQLDHKQDFIFRSQENIKNLMLLKKFEFAIQACEDLLSIDPRNQFGKKAKSDCEAQLKILLRETTIQQISEKSAQQTKEYREKPEDFIAI
jgi:tetratricopeptide (TPR) repeat protein